MLQLFTNHSNLPQNIAIYNCFEENFIDILPSPLLPSCVHNLVRFCVCENSLKHKIHFNFDNSTNLIRLIRLNN